MGDTSTSRRRIFTAGREQVAVGYTDVYREPCAESKNSARGGKMAKLCRRSVSGIHTLYWDTPHY